MLRTWLERVSRNRVLHRRLPTRLGGDSVYVSPDSALGYWRWNLERGSSSLFEFADEFVKAGASVWDVGANVGMFTFASAFRAGPLGQVVALEPDPFLVGLLRKSTALMSPERAKTTILPVAASDSLGLAELQVAQRGRSSNYLASSSGNSQTGGVRETVSVFTVTLDWLAERLPAPSVLKIDVEGAEAAVLAGAAQLISAAKPVVLCEVSARHTETCTRFFRSHGYELFDADCRRNGPLEQTVFNTLAIWRG